MAAVVGRVLSVRPRDDGSFAVTMILGLRRFGWMLAPSSPRVGALLKLEGATTKTYKGNEAGAEVVVLTGGETTVVDEPWARRYVPRPWLTAVAKASRVRLFPHQLEGAGWLAQRLAGGSGAILADDQGLGKTVQAGLALLVAGAFPALIVCPSTLKRAWERELRDMLSVELRVAVLDGYDGGIPPSHVIISNYDLLRARETQLRALKAKSIVFDEGQILKEPAPNEQHRAAVATRLAHSIGRAVILSGTPLPNRPRELWRLLHVVGPEDWPDFNDFNERYCLQPEEEDLVKGRHVVTDYGRVHHLDELQARVAPYMLRRLKSQVLTHLPAKERRTVMVDLDEADQELYERVEKNVVEWLRSVGYARRADSAARGQALVKLQMLRRVAAMAKLRRAVPAYLEQWFAKHERGLVIFGFHAAAMRRVKHICRDLGLRIATIHRKHDDRKRQAAVDAFNDHRADVFIAPIRAAGVGINLQLGGNHVLFLERMWTPTLMWQAEDRVHRLGQKHTVQITYLDARRTIDEHIARVLMQKQRIIDVVVDDRERDEDELERETFTEVMESMEHGVDDDSGAPSAPGAHGEGGQAGGTDGGPHRNEAAGGDVLRERPAGAPPGA